MRLLLVALLGATMSATALADSITFDTEIVGTFPVGWTAGVTGKGNPKWAIATDEAEGGHKVLLQSGAGTFPWCVRRSIQLADGFVEVRFKPISGSEDQAGGVIWRWKDGDNYYVARANALENNVSLYFTEGGHRKTLKYVDAPVARGLWHTLRVEFSGTRLRVLLDGKRYIELDDDHIAGTGAVGLWTKADSVTAFRDFSFGNK